MTSKKVVKKTKIMPGMTLYGPVCRPGVVAALAGYFSTPHDSHFKARNRKKGINTPMRRCSAATSEARGLNKLQDRKG